MQALSTQVDRHDDDDTLDAAFDRWQDARERLWYRADTLLGHLDAGRTEALAEVAHSLQTEADQAARAAQGLVVVLQEHAKRWQAAGVQTARWGAALTVALLMMLAAGVVGPALRAMQAQARRLTLQAAENERLAVVAEHTGNLVVITDRERRIVWANEAFTRVAGYELHEVIGRKPGDLLQSERTDGAAVLRVRAALDQGLPVRAELINRSRDGRDYWIDADIQPLHDGNGQLAGLHRRGDRHHRTGDAAPARGGAAGRAAHCRGAARPWRRGAGGQPHRPQAAGRAAR